jgi:hypothetical protein
MKQLIVDATAANAAMMPVLGEKAKADAQAAIDAAKLPRWRSRHVDVIEKCPRARGAKEEGPRP